MWFPDEPICRLLDVTDWVKHQRRIAKKAAPGSSFMLAMLQRDCRISQGIKGIDPDRTDRERAQEEIAWLKSHPAITEAEREIMRASAAKLKSFSPGFGGKKECQHQG